MAQEQKGGSLQHTWTSALIISKRHSLSNQKILLILLKGIVYFLLPHYLIRSITVKKRLIGVGSLFQECDIGTKWMVILLKCFKYLCLPAVHQGLLRIALPRSDSDSRIEEEEIIFLNILLTICTLYKAKEVIFIFFYGDW